MKNKPTLSVFLLFLLFACISHTYAHQITVTDGGDSGPGTLRNAISTAVSEDTIIFSGVSTVSLTSDELLISNKGITIDGGVTKVTITRTVSSPFRIFKLDGTASSQVVFKNLIITNGRNNNQAGGIENGVNLTMENCTVSGNQSDQGAGIQNDEVLTMTNCLIIDNIYDGGLLAGGTSVTATNCVFSGNGGFGIESTTSNLVLTNCIVSNNYSSSVSRKGTGIRFNSAVTATITNCTFAANAEEGIRCSSFQSGITLVNNIVSNNSGKDIQVSSSGSLGATCTNNLIGSSESGGLVDGVNGNIVNTPANFLSIADPDGSDNIWLTADDGFSITPSSPALNSGTNSGILSTDILGNTRPYDSGISDMGAYEYSQAVPPPSISMQPADTVACEGSGAKFGIVATNASSYKWQVKIGAAAYIDISPSAIYSDVTTDTLVISNVTGLAGNLYRCIAFNVLNETVTSTAGTISLTSAPQIAYSGQNSGYQTGVPITPIVATLTGGSVDMLSISPALVAGLNFNTTTGEISGTPSASSSSTTYTVSATNACGTNTAVLEFSTSSLAPPVITQQPVDAFVCAAEAASFTIDKTGFSTDIQWQLNSGSGWSDVPNAAPYQDEDEETLIITGSSGLNGFKYRCIVSNNSGTVISNEVTLTEGGTTKVVSNGNDTGTGSLREIINCSSSGDTILFASGVTVVTLTSEELLVNKSLTIDGGQNMVEITRGSESIFRIFHVQSGNVVVFNKLKITNGERTDQAGGIQNGGHLTLNFCEITGNEAPQGNGIQNDEIMVLNNCLVNDNNGNPSGNGMTIFGDSTTANNTIFSSNGGSGMVTFSGGAVVTLSNCLFVGNSGRGLSFSGGSGSSIINSTFANNGSNGIRLGDKAANITIVNSVISGNTGSEISHSTPDLGATSTNNLVGSTAAGGLVNGVNGNIVNMPALFLNDMDADGADNTWFTADDGFSLNACSPALNSGTASGTSATDILATARFGLTDMGAYELQSPNALEAIVSNVIVDLIDVCSGSTVTLTGSCAGAGIVTWYNTSAAGTALGTGVSFIQNPTENTTYYAACSNGICEGPRMATEEVRMLPQASALDNTVNLSVNFTADSIQLANEYINATNKIISPADIIYHSGKAVNLNPGFEVENGSVFLAKADLVACP